jgi:hypothetical protein
MGNYVQRTTLREKNSTDRRSVFDLRPLTKDPNTITIAVLGAPESGKSTITTHFRHLFKNPLTQSELLAFKHAVYFNAFYAMDQMLEASGTFAARDAKSTVRKDFFTRKDFVIEDDRTLTISAIVHELVEAEIMGGFSPYGKMDHKNIHMLKKLWDEEPVVRKAFMRGNEFGLVDSCLYMMQNLDRFADENYIPTITDVLNLRVTTVETSKVRVDLSQLIPVHSHSLIEHKKYVKVKVLNFPAHVRDHTSWITEITQHMSDSTYAPHVDIVLYIISLSEYDQLDENGQHRIEASLKLFEQTVNSSDMIGEAEFYLVFNKRDLFIDKIIWKDLFTCVPLFSSLKRSDLMLHRPVQPNPHASNAHIDEILIINRDKNLLNPIIDKYCSKDAITETNCEKEISDLNTSDLIYIFSYLNANDLCQVNRVCYLWYLLSGSDILWFKICSQHQPTLTEEFVQQIFAENVFTVYSTRLRETRTLRRTHRVSDRIAYFNQIGNTDLIPNGGFLQPKNSHISNVRAMSSSTTNQNTPVKPQNTSIMSMLSPRDPSHYPLIKPVETRPLLRELQIKSAHMYKSYFITMRRLFQSNVDFLVDQYLQKVQDENKRKVLKNRIYITSALNANDVMDMFQSVTMNYINT